MSVSELTEAKSVDEAISILFRMIDRMLSRGDSESIDDLLESLDTEVLHVDVLMAVLAITVPARKQLRNREKIASSIRPRLVKAEGEDRASQILDMLLDVKETLEPINEYWVWYVELGDYCATKAWEWISKNGNFDDYPSPPPYDSEHPKPKYGKPIKLDEIVLMDRCRTSPW
jgi:hypothetical protein